MTELAAALDPASGITAKTIFSLCAADPRMRVNQAQYMFLAEWGNPRREIVSEAVKAILEAADAPLEFKDLVANVERRTGRPCSSEAVSSCLEAFEATVDPVSGKWSPRDLHEDRSVNELQTSLAGE
jgi:hypothetical protein